MSKWPVAITEQDEWCIQMINERTCELMSGKCLNWTQLMETAKCQRLTDSSGNLNSCLVRWCNNPGKHGDHEWGSRSNICRK